MTLAREANELLPSSYAISSLGGAVAITIHKHITCTVGQGFLLKIHKNSISSTSDQCWISNFWLGPGTYYIGGLTCLSAAQGPD